MFYQSMLLLFISLFAYNEYEITVMQNSILLNTKIRNKVQFESIAKAELSYMLDNCVNSDYTENDIDFKITCSEEDNVTTYKLIASKDSFYKDFHGTYTGTAL